MQKVLVEGQETNKDFSQQWVQGNPDLQYIEQAFSITQLVEEIEKRDLDMEFRLLRRLTETQYHTNNFIDISPDTQKMNRYNNILPFKHTQVQLNFYKDEEENLKEIYINANFIQTVIGGNKNMIATQGPLQNTIQHFWRMIHQEKINVIVMLCNLRENGKIQCEQYWPKQIGDTSVWGAVKIKLDSTEELGPSIVHRHLKVSIEGEVEEHSVTQIHWSGWIDQSVPQSQDFELLLQIINLIVTRCLQNQKVVFHCSAGIGRTGTLISLCNIMMTLRSFMTQVSNDPKEIINNPESFKLSIFGTVRRLREQRWGMVHTPEQYNYIYKFIEKVMNSFLEK